MSAPKIPQMTRTVTPAAPVRADDPALYAAREEQVRRARSGGQNSSVLAPLNGGPPQTQLKLLLGL